MKENTINIIFAVTEEQISIYEKLKTHIEGASVGKLSNDSSNIVELVKEQYEKISSTVTMKHEAASFIKINYFTSCQGGEVQNTNKCGNIKVGNNFIFRNVTFCLRVVLQKALAEISKKLVPSLTTF